MHRAASSYHPLHRSLLCSSLGTGPHGPGSSQKGGKGRWSQNASQAFQLQPLASELIFHVVSVSTRFNVSLMLNIQNVNSYDEPSRSRQWRLPWWGCHLELELLWVQESSLNGRLYFVLYTHGLRACPQREWPQSLRSLHPISEPQTVMVIQRPG